MQKRKLVKKCRCCGGRVTFAEKLLDLAWRVRPSRGGVEFRCEDLDTMAALVKMAFRLEARPALALRAIVEEWSRKRLVTELY